MALSQEQLMKILGYSGLGAGAGGALGQFFSNSPGKAANNYLDQIPGQAGQYQQPYVEAGKNALPVLQGQYGDLTNNPGKKLNEMGGEFHNSPGFKFALDQALGASGRASAAGGMAGSPQHEQENMGIATNLGNQDYYNWLGKTTDLYGKGLEGEKDMAHMGQDSAKQMSDMISSILAQKGNIAYGEQSAKNQNWGDIASTIMSVLPFLL